MIYEDAILEELGEFEANLIEALYDCYKNSDLVVRQDGKAITIQTKHNLKKYLNIKDIESIYLPLLEMVRREN